MLAAAWLHQTHAPCPTLRLPPAAAIFPTPSRTATRDWQQLQPLACPVGFRNATGEADTSILWAMLWQFFGNQAVSGLAGWLVEGARLMVVPTVAECGASQPASQPARSDVAV